MLPSADLLDRFTDAIIRDPLIIAPDQPVRVAIDLMNKAVTNDDRSVPATDTTRLHQELRSSCVLVQAHGRVVGIVTARDLIRQSGDSTLAQQAVERIMSQPLIRQPQALLDSQAALELLQNQQAQYLVLHTAGDHLIGFVTRESLLWQLNTTVTAAAHQASKSTTSDLQPLEHQVRVQQAELLRSQTHLLAAQRIAQLGSWEFNPQTKSVSWSDEVFRIFGRDPALGPPTFEQLSQNYLREEAARHQQMVGQSLATGQPYEIEMRIYRPDGEQRVVYARGEPILDATQTIQHLVGTLLDVTDRKRAELQRHDLNDQLELAVKSAAIGIWDWNIPKNVLTWDARMHELYDISAEEFASVYNSWLIRIHPDDQQATSEAIAQALRGEREYDTEFRVVHSNNSIHYLKAYGLVQRDAHGAPQRMIGVNFDITDRRQAENQIRETAAQLQVANHELEAFAYSVSHDLRSPLRAIDGFSQALLEEYASLFDTQAQAYFQRIRANVQRMGMLIDDLLQLSQVSRTEMRYSEINLSTLVQRIITDLHESQPGRQVTVRIEPNLIAQVDGNLMRIVLDNLLQNAWKFTSQHASALIEFGCTLDDNQPTFFIRDDGAGFDMAYADKLFGVFQRLHDTHEFYGTGIGLATVQRIIARHHGRVWARSAIEQGATFFFYLPGTRLASGATP